MPARPARCDPTPADDSVPASRGAEAGFIGYTRAGGKDFSASFDAGHEPALPKLERETLTPKQALTASGVRYTDARITRWAKGPGVLIERDGIVIHKNCPAVLSK